jgi:hypothetical protein
MLDFREKRRGKKKAPTGMVQKSRGAKPANVVPSSGIIVAWTVIGEQ